MSEFIIGETIRIRFPKPAEPLRPDFATVLEQIYRDEHTGVIPVHFLKGVPVMVDFPQEPMRIRLDRRKRPRV